MKERVLVVDDEAGVRGVLSALLEAEGYDPCSVESADQASEQLQADDAFHLVLTDMMMPHRDGLSLLDQISSDHPGLPVVLVSAVRDSQAITSAFRRGAIDYLLKPFGRTELNDVVSRALERGRLLKQQAVYQHNLQDLVEARTRRLREALLALERSYDFTLEAMGDALDLRDEETEGHSRRVTAYAIELARELGMNAEQLREIARGAFLHDIGKIAIPDSILLKPGKLDAEEMAVMKEHCALGYGIVRKIPFLQNASEIVYAHQERFDGKGYPRGLAREEIPLGARVFAIADTMDAMTSDRPYRKGTSFELAQEEIARHSGTQFDPEIVEVFKRIPVGRWMELRAEIATLPQEKLSSKLWRPGASCEWPAPMNFHTKW